MGDDNRVNGSTIPTILTRMVSMLCTQLPLLKEEGMGNTNNIDISRILAALLATPGYTADGGGPKKIGETKDAEITPLTVDPSLTFNAVGAWISTSTL